MRICKTRLRIIGIRRRDRWVMDELRLEFGHWGESSRACGMIASYKNSTKKREDFEVEVNDTLSLDRIPVSARFKKDSC